MAANAQIPIIDISANGADQADVARRLVDAAAEHGFIYIKNTGNDISADLIQRTFELVSIARASSCNPYFSVADCWILDPLVQDSVRVAHRGQAAM